MEWHSYHIFIHDMSYHDLFLNNYLSTFLEEQNRFIKLFFFIRYWQGGPHIRFRFQSEYPEFIVEALKNKVEDFKRIYTPKHQLTKDEYYKQHSFDGQKPDESELYWCEDLSVKNIPYHPELERYGGEKVMSYSENIFNQTSLLALDKISEYKGKLTLPIRMMLACDFFQVLKEHLSGEEYEKLLKSYEKFWSKFNQGGNLNTDEIKKFAALYWRKKDTGSDMHSRGREINKNINMINELGHRKKLPYYIFSYLHMYNNRIGLPPNLESTVAQIMRSNIGRSVKQ